MAQSFTNFELIIVDDGSVDGSRSIAQSFARQDPRIRVVCQQHCGLVGALNRGCRIARGKYIARLDADDLAMPQRVEQQVEYMQNNDVALLGGGIECINAAGDRMFVVNLPSWRQGLRDRLLVNCYIAHTTVMFARDVFVELGGYRSHFEDAEDYDLFLRMSDHHVIDNLPTIVCQYRLHSDQVSVRKASQQIISSRGRLASRIDKVSR